MNVAIVHEHVDTRRGGAETSVLELAAALAALDCRVTVIAAGDRNPAAAPLGFAIQRVAVSGGRLARARQFVAGAEARLRAGAFDVVHAVTPCRGADVYQPRGGLYPETIARSIARARSPLHRWLKRQGRRLNRRQQYLLAVEREMLAGPRRPVIAAVSRYVADQVARHYPAFPRDRVELVFNGVTIEPLDAQSYRALRDQTRRRLGLPPGQRVILFVAHNFPLKGLPELLDACGRLPSEPAWTLLVAGRSRRRPQARGLSGDVRFLGAGEPVRALYAAADALAHPTWYDPCSRVVLEALSFGLPVVTTRYNGAADAIERGACGEVIDEPDHAAALAGALTRCLDPGLHARCRDTADRRRDALSMARHARELHALYRRLLEGAPAT